MQNKNSFDPSRRSFFAKLIVGGAALAVASASKMFGGLPKAFAAGEPALDPKDPLATSLGYHTKAASVDKKKWPKFAESAGQACSSCQFYTAGAAGTGLCAIFPGKSVTAAGWCNSWIKKAA